jgi:hypothetical protein
VAIPRLGVAGAIYYDWTGSNANLAQSTWVNTSSAGTITGTSPHVNPFTDGFFAKPGLWGVPTPISTQPPFNWELDIFANRPGSTSVNFVFTNGLNDYAWGAGGTLLLGNIHNFYEYRLSAWDFAGNQIDVNTWSIGAEYGFGPNSDPTGGTTATLGYISTSDTLHSADPADAFSELFYVIDNRSIPNFDLANLGQGGVFTLTGVRSVQRIQLTLTNSHLGANAQSDDFILFNVATAVPEPSSVFLITAGLVSLAAYRSRKRRSEFSLDEQLPDR